MIFSSVTNFADFKNFTINTVGNQIFASKGLSLSSGPMPGLRVSTLKIRVQLHKT